MRQRSIRTWLAVALLGPLLSMLCIASIASVPAVAGTDTRFLQDVDALSTSDVWAVGNHPNPADPDELGTLAEHWDGTSWSVVPTPNDAERDHELTGVATIASNDVWAVGHNNQPSFRDQQIVVLHWNGSVWSKSPAPNPSFNDSLMAVDGIASNDVWAVGGYSTGGNAQNASLIEHWNGSTWTVVDHPHFYGLDFLNDVAAIGPNDVWAVGIARNGFSERTLTLHCDGISWTGVASPDHGQGMDNVLTGVSATAKGEPTPDQQQRSARSR
jgi:hypothetical protein